MSRFGEELRRERELRRITLREVSETTKISLRHLEALERNDFQHLPGGVFNRGFVRAYAQFIGVDPEAMVNAYLLEEKAQETRQETQDQPRGPRVHRPSAAHLPTAVSRRHWGVRLAWGLLLLILVVGLIGAVYLVIERAGGDPSQPGSPEPSSSVSGSSLGPGDEPGAAESIAAQLAARPVNGRAEGT